MIADKIKELMVAKARLAEKEAALAATITRELASLPARYGFASPAAFTEAVMAASGKPKGEPTGAVKGARTRKRRRVTITDSMRAQVKKLVGENKTAKEIAAAVGISVPSVANVKKQLGLVRKS